jgi:hypothetical protein
VDVNSCLPSVEVVVVGESVCRRVGPEVGVFVGEYAGEKVFSLGVAELSRSVDGAVMVDVGITDTSRHVWHKRGHAAINPGNSERHIA